MKKNNFLKYIFYFFTVYSHLVYSPFAFSLDGVVIVLEAPLLKKPALNSTVLQTLRKGDRVYIPNEIGTIYPLPEFIQTYDRAGDTAYIPRAYVKVITNDSNESHSSVTFPGHDPTDYRLEELIPSTYPFDNTSFLRTSLAFNLGNSVKPVYKPDSITSSQTLSLEYGVRFSFTRKIVFDKYDRYYFGFISFLSSANSNTSLLNNGLLSERYFLFRIGPSITFDAYKSFNYRLTLGTGFTYNLHKNSLKMKNGLQNALEEEERSFTGYSLSPLVNSTLQISDVFPMIDFIMGTDFSLFLPHIQKSNDQIVTPELWSRTDSTQLKSDLKLQLSLFLGIQAKY